MVSGHRFQRIRLAQAGLDWSLMATRITMDTRTDTTDATSLDLAAFLRARGYTAVPLTVNAVGHFELVAQVNGQAARLLLDTGASHTVVATPSAARLGLLTSPAGARAGGVGAADHPTETTTIAALELGALTLRDVEAYAFDLSHVNQALAARGGVLIDGALGGDVLRPAAAVIDYAQATLYLRSGL